MSFNKSQYIATIRATKIRNENGKQMLVALAEMADSEGRVKRILASSERMGKRCGINPQTAQKYLQRLKAKGLISIIRFQRRSWIKLAAEDNLSTLI
jgi:hypothetical protein